MLADFNISFIHDQIIQMMNDIINLYLVIKEDNEKRAKLTIRTVLMSLNKWDLNVFYKYYEMFHNTLFKIKRDNTLSSEKINAREVAFALLTQIKLIVNSYNDDDILRDIIEKDFSTLKNKNFHLFRCLDNKFIINITQIESITEFREFIKNIIINSSNELLKKYF